ncbi:MAG TPA: response regulator, partial [bacterium]|nr:response regulator [bacterium]
MSLLKILCIDDDPHVHQLLNEAFREKGHSYSYSLTGAQGLSMVQRERFDIVVIDLILPDILGWEICRT